MVNAHQTSNSVAITEIADGLTTLHALLTIKSIYIYLVRQIAIYHRPQDIINQLKSQAPYQKLYWTNKLLQLSAHDSSTRATVTEIKYAMQLKYPILWNWIPNKRNV